ncbi:MAG: transcription-repair coupling factor [Immundisolibacteraceae bacterium]|nr:transcription-repair coupling factor [Immundisolibacteraceae bacterium]
MTTNSLPPALNTLVSGTGPGVVPWQPGHGSDQARFISDLAATADRPLLVVADSITEVQPLADAIAFYSSGDSPPPMLLPDWEMLPYDHFSPDQELISERLSVLHRIRALERGVVVVAISTLLQRLAPIDYLDRYSLWLDQGQSLDLEGFRERLSTAGYTFVNQVIAHGDFTIRGGILDLFPMGSKVPFRIELFDDHVESIRTFDPETQRSNLPLDQAHLLPGREFPITDESITLFFQNFQAHLEANASQAFLYRELKSGRIPAGIEFYLPLFFNSTATLFDYLPRNTLVVYPDDCFGHAERFWAMANERREHRQVDIDRPPLPATLLYQQANELFNEFKNWPAIKIERLPSGAPLPDVSADAHSPKPIQRLQEFIDSNPVRLLLVAESNGRREALISTLRGSGLTPDFFSSFDEFLASSSTLAITVSPLIEGLYDPDAQLIIITESMLFGKQEVAQRHRRQRDPDLDAIVRDLSELRIGDPVVHVDHGVGRYQGLQVMEVGGSGGEFLCLEYAESSRIYVPVAKLNMIHRFAGSAGSNPPLHKLGNAQWTKARKKAQEKAHDAAAELLEIYARRAARKGFAYPLDQADYENFGNSFPYETTPDQSRTITEVTNDLQAPQPMDRVVCGDVGFGKTEVAVRAAYVVAAAGRQVALLVPTTLLVQQHTESFQDRFADTPYKIAGLSRFQTPKEQRAVQDAMASGEVDIVIGTQKLLGKEIKFGDLGLLIIDEEHRFGVRQKERFKSLRAEVDILNLTATPIPRTLSMAVSGLRDLSMITTPPQRRMPVKTFVRTWDPLLIKEACQREFSRGGQVYLIHNRVETIDKIAREIGELLPDASIRTAHGQLPERTLENIMLDFTHQRFNLLVCTTIVESGIDVPSANTIIIDRADHLGLAQLHQLRGRVGRSHHQAYAYILVPDKARLRGDALQRLEAIEALGDLGIGFSLATHDLEIRGAGELLGDQQSGRIQEVGLTLYHELLERAVADLKADGDQTTPAVEARQVELDFRLPALLPEDYLPDVHSRLVIYKRIAACSSEDALKELQVELIDRFGLLPTPAKNCFRLATLKLQAASLGIKAITANSELLTIQFSPDPKIDLEALISLIQGKPREYRFDGATRLEQRLGEEDVDAQLDKTHALLTLLTPTDQQQVA